MLDRNPNIWTNKFQNEICFLCKSNLTWEGLVCAKCAGVIPSGRFFPKDNSRLEQVQESPLRVLLVEDNPLTQFVHKKMLAKMSCNVDVASNGKEALSIAENFYDLILLDVGLPDIRGSELAIKIRTYKNHKETPIIVVTAFSLEEIKRECWSANIIHFLNKPIDIEMLNNLISKIFGGQRKYEGSNGYL